MFRNIYKECGGIVYHITNAKGARSILQSGLRMKQGNYRYFPKRTYVIAAGTDLKNAIEQVLRSKMSPNVSIEHAKRTYRLLKIDVSGTNIHFYHDDYYEHPGIVYAYSNFPYCKITKIDWDDIN